LKLRPERLSEQANPGFIGRRQQHIHCITQAALEFVPRRENEYAGLALIQNNDFYFLFVIGLGAQPNISLIKRAAGIEEILAERPLTAGRICLKVEAHEQNYNFYFSNRPDEWQLLAENVDGRILSTPVAGGFVGTFIGMYASSNGGPDTNHVDFDWFEYTGLDEKESISEKSQIELTPS
jgi:xylan 1,4-beta-xylosidase